MVRRNERCGIKITPSFPIRCSQIFLILVIFMMGNLLGVMRIVRIVKCRCSANVHQILFLLLLDMHSIREVADVNSFTAPDIEYIALSSTFHTAVVTGQIRDID